MIRQHSDGSLTMDWDDFQAFDYGRLCSTLGLSPSRPRLSADAVRREAQRLPGGMGAKRRRRRRRSAPPA